MNRPDLPARVPDPISRRFVPRRLSVVTCLAVALAVAGGFAGASKTLGEEKLIVYVGTYTSGESEGIYVLELDPTSGAMTKLGSHGDIPNPSFLAIHPNQKWLFAVSEVRKSGQRLGGAVNAFALDPQTHLLSKLNQQSSGGAGPCHVSVDPSGKNALVANYAGGSCACLPIAQDGSLKPASSFFQHEGSSVNPQRQQEAHAHSINVDQTGKFAFVADLGIDKILVYSLDAASGKLAPHTPSSVSVQPGAGPRHFALHPSGKFAYVINELASTITALAWDAASGSLKTIESYSTLPSDFSGSTTTAEVQVHPSGQFVYGSNRGHDSIAVFRIDPATGKLTFVEHESTQGKTPRNFGIDPSGQLLLAANQNTSNIFSFRIDAATGSLAPTGHSIDIPNPVCVRIIKPQ